MNAAPALLVLANAADRAASDFAARHAAQGVALVTPRDFSRPGWTFSPAEPGGSIACIEGERVLLAEVGGILPRLAAVTAADLPHIVAEDRDYVAAEMTAYLLAVMTSAGMRIANRPTPQCLCGPAWSDARWCHVAASCGLPFRTLRMQATFGAALPIEPEQSPGQVSVVGGRCVSGADSPRAEAACRLAAIAGADMLTVGFEGPGPDAPIARGLPWVDLDDPDTERAVLALFGIPTPAGITVGNLQPAQNDPALGT